MAVNEQIHCPLNLEPGTQFVISSESEKSYTDSGYGGNGAAGKGAGSPTVSGCKGMFFVSAVNPFHLLLYFPKCFSIPDGSNEKLFDGIIFFIAQPGILVTVIVSHII